MLVLRKIFGDEIYYAKKHNSEVSGEKEIIKLDEEAIEYDNKIRSICENISDNEFDTNIGTMLVVAHRLSTIQHSDKIFVLQFS